ncbi:MAG: MCE family protein [Parvularculaceae bacterium]|nr:MCE family protein [Parvularculaceae bacterium]
METRANFVLIGAIVLGVIASAFLFILWLGQSQRDFDEYDIIFRERVSGLSVGAAVRFNGIQKGEVRELNIAPDNPAMVIARVRVDNDTPVKTDTRAELELVGFTGLAVIQLVGGSPGEPLLKDVTRGVPRIEADASGLAAFLEGSGEIVVGANRLLSEENTAAVTRILLSIDEVAKTVAGQQENISLTLENTAKLTSDLSAATADFASAAKKIDMLMSEDAPGAVKDARKTLQESQMLIADMRAMLEENREPLRQFTDQGLSQVGPAVTEARILFRTLDQVLREIDRDPRGYLLGESTPRYEGQQ